MSPHDIKRSNHILNNVKQEYIMEHFYFYFITHSCIVIQRDSRILEFDANC